MPLEDCTDEPHLPLKRLFSEHCGMNGTSVHLKKRLEGSSLQSPYDPDASFGHKGSGYSVHVTETCGNDGKPEIITDYEVHGAARSDMGKAVDVIERLDTAGLKPDTLFADGGYPSAVCIEDRRQGYRAPWLPSTAAGSATMSSAGTSCRL